MKTDRAAGPEIPCDAVFGIPEMEKWLKKSKPTICRLIELGLPCEKLGGEWVFSKTNVNRWIQERTANASPKDPKQAG